MPARINAPHADPATRLAEIVDAIARWHAIAIGPHSPTRARLLIELEEPATTSQLARRLGLAAPDVSQHPQRLRRACLVTADRDGREVRYRRTPLAAELVRAACKCSNLSAAASVTR